MTEIDQDWWDSIDQETLNAAARAAKPKWTSHSDLSIRDLLIGAGRRIASLEYENSKLAELEKRNAEYEQENIRLLSDDGSETWIPDEIAHKDATITGLLSLLREVQDQGFNHDREMSCCPICGMQSYWLSDGPQHTKSCRLDAALKKKNND